MFSTLAMRKVFNLIGIDPHRHRIDIDIGLAVEKPVYSRCLHII